VERLVREPIALLRALDLRVPIRAAFTGSEEVRVAVPEAAIDKDSDTPSREREIGLPG
jgi:hypothetical protein